MLYNFVFEIFEMLVYTTYSLGLCELCFDVFLVSSFQKKEKVHGHLMWKVKYFKVGGGYQWNADPDC